MEDAESMETEGCVQTRWRRLRRGGAEGWNCQRKQQAMKTEKGRDDIVFVRLLCTQISEMAHKADPALFVGRLVPVEVLVCSRGPGVPRTTR